MASESYRIRKNDLIVTAFYDDGTERILKEKEYELNPETADGLSDSYTGTVTFREDGIVRTDTFQVKIQPAQASERITVTYNLSGGSIIPDGESSLQETYVLRIKKGSVLTKPVNVPTREGYQFLGWVDRDGIGTEAEAAEHAFDFSKVQDASVTIHAAWEQNAVQVKYAVSIYGIQEDTVKGGDLAGLTFGPATGENYNHTHKKHVPVSGYPCIHDMSWEEIIKQSREDPTVFTECMENGCTHSVFLTIRGKLMGKTAGQGTEGDGAGALLTSINEGYRFWNRPESAYFTETDDAYKNGTGQGGWTDSAIRNTLNGTVTWNMKQITNKPTNGDADGVHNTMFYEDGSIRDALTEETALIGAFPDILQKAIVPKTVKSDTVHTNTSSSCVTTYDKLWLYSGREYFNSENSADAIRPNEGKLYDRQKTMGNRSIIFAESGPEACWLRSLSRTQENGGYYIAGTGGWAESTAATGHALAPGFCLPGPQMDVKYAVSIYGIQEDTYRKADGTTGTAGLTFGPATGKSYWNTYKNHTPSGITVSGHVHRCIHADSWETIAAWSKKDPCVYEQCLDGGGSGESCTKAVPLTLNGKLKRSWNPPAQLRNGDGTGVLQYSIADVYRNWNHQESAYFAASSNQYTIGTNQGGWADSAIRNALTGIVTDNMKTKTNAPTPDGAEGKHNQMFYPDGTNNIALNEEEALISCFPDALKTAIVPKTVKSDSVSGNTTDKMVTTYDKLWLFSGKERRGGPNENDRRPNEGKTYSRQQKLGITDQTYEKNIAYCENGAAATSWLRSIYRLNQISCYVTDGNGNWRGAPVWNHYGISPGFCLE